MTVRTVPPLHQVPAPGMKQVSGGIYYTAAGAIFGVIGVARVLTLVQPALDRFASFACGTGPASGLGIDRSEVFVAILCGVLAIVCAEVGSRRYARPKWIGMMGSILGVFSLLAGALIAVELFISPAASCVK